MMGFYKEERREVMADFQFVENKIHCSSTKIIFGAHSKKSSLMKKIFVLAALFHFTQHSYSQAPSEKIQYPPAKKGNVVDNYFGTNVADPYRWLEDDNSDETKAWVQAENKVTFDYLSKITYRDAIKKRIRGWREPKLTKDVCRLTRRLTSWKWLRLVDRGVSRSRGPGCHGKRDDR